MTAANRRNGVVTEQIAARWFRENGFPHCERVVRTGYRTADRDSADAGDLALAPGVIAQVKALRPLVAAEAALPRWYEETLAQGAAANADLALLIVRRYGTTNVGKWWAFLPVWNVVDLATIGNPGYLPTGIAWPARLACSDVVQLLRAGGYGRSLDDAFDDSVDDPVAVAI